MPAPQDALCRSRAASSSDGRKPDGPAQLEGRDDAGNPPLVELAAADREGDGEFSFREEFQFVARRGDDSCSFSFSAIGPGGAILVVAATVRPSRETDQMRLVTGLPCHHLPAQPGTDHGGDGEGVVRDWKVRAETVVPE